MNLGEKILNLRKEAKLSQEQLAEKLGVTRQTISNWELNETSPDINQAKDLSKVFNISLDELTNNDIKSILESRVSNTEKLAGLILKILKVIGVLFLVLLIIDFISIIVVATLRQKGTVELESTEVEMTCRLDEQAYLITIGSDGYFNCSNCSAEIQHELKNEYVDYSDLEGTVSKIENYFITQNGTCD